jgi:2-dehydro-3-deoxygluconokinase
MSARIVCFGELLLRLAAPGRERLLQTPRLDVRVGGAEANVAVSLAHFGHHTAMVGTVADNALGEAALGELRRHGVDIDGVLRRQGRMGLYFLATGAGHRPSEVLYDRADSAFANTGSGHYDWPAALAGAAVLHVSGVTPALGRTTADTAIAAARAARAAGAMVSFDGNYRPKLWAAWGGDPRSILPIIAISPSCWAMTNARRTTALPKRPARASPPPPRAHSLPSRDCSASPAPCAPNTASTITASAH